MREGKREERLDGEMERGEGRRNDEGEREDRREREKEGRKEEGFRDSGREGVKLGGKRMEGGWERRV